MNFNVDPCNAADMGRTRAYTYFLRLHSAALADWCERTGALSFLMSSTSLIGVSGVVLEHCSLNAVLF